MKLVHIFLVLVASCAAAFVVASAMQPGVGQKKETTYERVIRTQTLRCGYIPYAYDFIVDPNTKKMSGVMYDVMAEVGRLTQLNIAWTEELTWATIVPAIESGRIDAFCSGMWIDTQNGKFLAFSMPLFFNGVSIYGRANETRFTRLEDINDPSIRVVSRDGGTPGIIAQQDFPRAKVISLPSGVSDGEMLEQIFTNKADVIFYGDDYLMEYVRKNPHKLKPILPQVKLRVYATAIALPVADVALKNLIDNTIVEMKGSKLVDKALKVHAPPGSWMTNWPASSMD